MIWYHGTSKDVADRILRDGFRKGTFFAKALEDAIHMGGDYVFAVWLSSDPTKYWEWVSPRRIPATAIKLLVNFRPHMIYRNKTLEKRIRRQDVKQQNPSWDICKTCEGRGQMEDYPPLTRWRNRMAITPCPDCRGFGCIGLMEHTLGDQRK